MMIRTLLLKSPKCVLTHVFLSSSFLLQASFLIIYHRSPHLVLCSSSDKRSSGRYLSIYIIFIFQPTSLLMKWQQSQGLLPPGTQFDLFRGVAGADRSSTFSSSSSAAIGRGATTTTTAMLLLPLLITHSRSCSPRRRGPSMLSSRQNHPPWHQNSRHMCRVLTGRPVSGLWMRRRVH